ncbi:EF-hand calcium-binding domain-containing protein 11 isoform X4 [Dasypus novemcinctus]|uniref:EF-hand calcium-binding domain-containing protein 11 isoform X4 n=1 Tax=Dasypus novemcinctus TaxID=9361 RepID=UPI00265D9B05|nr:EF-hand calcium-binding domain-containing protein 11 isoform X4 [Dasypus novemcinctus]
MYFAEVGARPRTCEAGPSEHRKWAEVFKACDEDDKGYLSREDFKVAVVMLFGYKPSKIEVDSVMSSINQNTSDRGFLTLEDFKKAFKQVAPKLPERTILEVFRLYPGLNPGPSTWEAGTQPLSYSHSPLIFFKETILPPIHLAQFIVRTCTNNE